MTTLYDAMHFRLSRFLDGPPPPPGYEGNYARLGGRPCPEKTRAYLQQTAVVLTLEGERSVPIISMVSTRFQSDVRWWVRAHVVDKRLHKPILEDAVFIARRWPIKSLEVFVRKATLRMADGAFDAEWSLDGLSSEADEPFETHVTDDGLILAEWPKGGADLETVLRWWARKTEDSDAADGFRREQFDHLLEKLEGKNGKREREALLREASAQVGLLGLDALLASRARKNGEQDPVPERISTEEDELFIINTGQVRAAAVMYLAEQRARRRVFAADAAQYTLDYFRELTDNASGAAERRQAAEDAIREEEPSMVGDAHATDELANELRVQIHRLREKAGFDTARDGKALAEEGPEDGILVFDARYAKYIERIGQKGEAFAKKARDNAKERMSAVLAGAPDGGLWTLWTEKRFLRSLARALWCDVVARRLEKQTALVQPVYMGVLDFHAGGRRFDEPSGQLSFDGQEIARLTKGSVGLDLDLLRDGLERLGSVVAHKVFRWELFSAHDRSVRGEPHANTIRIDGGWSALATAIGLNPKKYAADVRAVVHAQAHFKFAFPDGSKGNMLSYTERDARGQTGRAQVTITLGAPLLPDYQAHVLEARGKVASAKDRRLVPIPRTLPPLTPRRNEHGGQISFSMAVMAEFREQASRLADDGAVELDHGTLTRLADRAGLSRRSILTVWEIWQAGTPDTLPYLRRVTGDLYDLADAYEPERRFIVEAGRRELAGSAAGKKSAKKRSAEIMRRGKK